MYLYDVILCVMHDIYLRVLIAVSPTKVYISVGNKNQRARGRERTSDREKGEVCVCKRGMGVEEKEI